MIVTNSVHEQNVVLALWQTRKCNELTFSKQDSSLWLITAEDGCACRTLLITCPPLAHTEPVTGKTLFISSLTQSLQQYCLGNGQMNIMVQVLPDIFEFGEFVRVSFIEFEDPFGDKKGLKCRLRAPFDTLRRQKGLEMSLEGTI